VPLELHDWEVDYAAWCSYKYLNGGPGAMSGAFIHRRHAADPDLPRYAGWWANDPDTRFAKLLDPEFVPRTTADGWQLSNPSVFSLAPLGASLELFDRAGRAALREKSERLTGYFAYLVEELCGDRVTVLTPADPARRGCQLSLRLATGARDQVPALAARGVVCDFREPDVLRAAPTPLYNSFEDVRVLVGTLAGEDPR
jgi:kynureninase